MESDRPGRPSLACGRLGGATPGHGCVALGAVIPRGGWGAGSEGGGGGGGGCGQTVILDAVSVGGQLEILPVHPGGADSRRRAVAAPQPATRVSAIDLQDLRRVVGAVARLRGEAVRAVTVRSDLRQLKVELESGLILVVSAERDAHDRPRLEVDVVEAPQDAAAKQQIEVRFD